MFKRSSTPAWERAGRHAVSDAENPAWRRTGPPRLAGDGNSTNPQERQQITVRIHTTPRKPCSPTMRRIPPGAMTRWCDHCRDRPSSRGKAGITSTASCMSSPSARRDPQTLGSEKRAPAIRINGNSPIATCSASIGPNVREQTAFIRGVHSFLPGCAAGPHGGPDIAQPNRRPNVGNHDLRGAS